MLQRVGLKADVVRAHPHGLRATLAVELVVEGEPLPVVRDVLGHASIANTDAYVRRVFPGLAITALARRSGLIGCGNTTGSGS
jgi:integrase/recombinase XerD